jgi:autophagy-related protein 2
MCCKLAHISIDRPGALDTMLRVHNCDVTISLYAGFDWDRTRQIVDKEVKVMRRKLQKIRQLLASGQTPDDSVEDTYTVLFNSVYIGLPPEADELDPNGLIAAIDEELNEDRDETVSQSSWQPLHRGHASSAQGKSERHHDTLIRSKHPSLQFCFKGAEAEFDMHQPDEDMASRLLVMIKDVEILDHIKTSTWKKFLTQMREDSKGNVRETDSNMVRIELVSVRPVSGDPSEEARLRASVIFQ